MLMIRLQRVGRKNDPSFRIIVTDSRRAAKKSNFVEVVGAYDARKGEPSIKADRVKYWMGMGAQPSDTVHNLLLKAKIVEGKKINVLPKKTVPKKEEVAAETPTPAVASVAVAEASAVEEAVAEESAPEAPAPEEESAPEAPAAEEVAEKVAAE